MCYFYIPVLRRAHTPVFGSSSLWTFDHKCLMSVREKVSVVCFCCSSVTVLCWSPRRQDDLLLLSSLADFHTSRLALSLMSPDRLRVLFGGFQRQVERPPRRAEPNVSRGCNTVIKNDSVSFTCRRIWWLHPGLTSTLEVGKMSK